MRSQRESIAANPDVVSVVGPYNSRCALELIPITNQARGGPLAVVSPYTSVDSLTRPAPRAPPDLMERLYPTGTRNYARTLPTDGSEAAANAQLAQKLGVRRVYVLHDGDDLFGRPRAIYFRNAARKLGMQVVGFRRWDPAATDYRPLATAVGRARAEGVFLGGGLYDDGGQVIAALRDRLGPRVAIFAPQFQPVSALFDEAGPAAAGTYVSLPGLTNDVLPAEGRRFAREFGATQPGGRVDVTAVYAAQATELLLDAIARSDGTRASVTKEVLAARVRGGLVGDFELTGTGDVTPRPITILRARQGGGAAVVGGTEGAVVDRVLDPPARLTELAP